MRKHFYKSLFCLLAILATHSVLQAQLQFEGFIYEGIGEPQLDLTSAVIVSSDGKQVYATSYNDNAITIFERNLLTGDLTFVNSFRNGDGGIQGLGGAFSIAISPDENHLYVAGSLDNSIVGFHRDLTDGSLTYASTVYDDQDGVDGINGVLGMTISPDGNYVYATGSNENSIAVFSRNVSTGALTFIQKLDDTNNELIDFSYPVGVTISPDGNQVYATSYDFGSVTVFDINKSTGEMTYQSIIETGINGVSGMDGAYGIQMSPDGKNIYVMGNFEASIAALTRDPNTGTLTFLESITDDGATIDGLDGALQLTMSTDGNYVYALGSSENAISFFSRSSNGSLNYIGMVQNGVNGVSKLDYPVGIDVSEDGDNVYVSSFNANAVVVFEREPSTGEIFFRNENSSSDGGVEGLDGPAAMAISEDDEYLYLASRVSDALLVFKRDATTGELNFIETYYNNDGDIRGMNGAQSVVVSPNGQYIYVGGFWDHSIAQFEKNTNGTLSFVARYQDNRDGFDGLNGISSMVMSPDGKYLYATSFWENTVTSFEINSSNGTLEFTSLLKDGVSGIDGLTWASGIDISPDGKHLYVTSGFDNSLTLVNTDVNTGNLSFGVQYKDGFNGINHLRDAKDVVISDNGIFVYACAAGDNAISVFGRNFISGELTLLSTIVEGTNDVTGLSGVNSITVDFSNRHLYATSASSNTTLVFNINRLSGALNFEKTRIDDTDGINGISGANDIIVSNSGRYIYVAGEEDNAIATFSCTYILDVEETICENDSVIVGGNIYKEAGNYRDTFETDGCYSIIALDLEVYPLEVETTVEICDGESYTFGSNTLTTAGTYVESFTSSLNCDSTVTLNLEVISEYTDIEATATICSGSTYSFGNTDYADSGIYTYTFQSRGGCDSTVMLELTVLESYDIVENIVICTGEFYPFNGRNYTETGTFMNNYTTVGGCDSTITLELTVLNDGEQLTRTASICEGDSYTLGDDTYTQGGTFNSTLTTDKGCEIPVTLTLTVNETFESMSEIVICAGEDYDFEGQTYNQSGSYSASYKNASGCDSVYLLELVVNTEITSTEVITEDDGNNTGNITLTVDGGEAPYTYVWSNGMSTKDIGQLTGGDYTVTITDANDCNIIKTYTVDTRTNTKDLDSKLGIQVLGNPIASGTDAVIEFSSDQSSEISASVFSASGQFVRQQTFRVQEGRSVHQVMLPIASGVYFVRLMDQNGYQKTLSISVF